MGRYKLQFLGISETHWNTNGHFRTSEENVVYMSSNSESARYGVGAIVSKENEEAVMGVRTMSDWLILVRMNVKPAPLSIIRTSLCTYNPR